MNRSLLLTLAGLALMMGCGGYGSGFVRTGAWAMRDTPYGPECFRSIRRYGEFVPSGWQNCVIDSPGITEMFTAPDADHCYADSEESVMDAEFCAENVTGLEDQ